MTDSLRERIRARLVAELIEWQAPHPDLMAAELTSAVFETMGDVRPCLDCGKGIGPAKVAKGYVLCYACSRNPDRVA